jgi:two-component system cell cycle sensor histidine kinase/response regulator CckA
MSTPLRILIVEDSADDAEVAMLEMSRGGPAPDWRRVENAGEMRAALAERSWDAVLSDFTMPGFGAAQAFAMCRESDPDLPFIVVSGTIGEQRAVEMMRAGAADYLLKNSLARLPAAVEREVREAENRRERRVLELATQRLASIVESSEDAILCTDLDGRVQSWNGAAERMFGYTFAEVVGRADVLIPPDLVGEVRERDGRLARGEHVPPFETVRMRKGGEMISVAVTLSPLRVGGQVVSKSALYRDITERKRSEEAFQASELRYRTLVAATAAIVWDSPASGEFDSDQPSWTAFTGQTLEQHRGWGWLNAIHPDDREHSGRAWATAVTSRTAYHVEHQVCRADGEYRHMSARAVPVIDPGGAILEWVGVHTDVTDQKRAEADLRTRDRAIQAATQGILITDPSQPDGPIVYASPGFERLTGYAAGEAVGRNCRFLQGRDTDPDAVARLRSAVREARPCTVELLNYRKDGSNFWNELSVSPVRDEDGRLTHFVGVQTDVTQRRLLEEQFRQSQKMEAFGQLAGGVAHDFNNLLTVINGYSDLLLMRMPPGDPGRVMVEEIQKAGELSASLTRQLLVFTRKQVVAPKVLDLDAIVADAEKMLRRMIGEDVRLETNLGGEGGRVRADPGQLEQVLMNLAVNARDAMPRGGCLTIETRHAELDEGHGDLVPGRYAVLAVSDTGSGMTREVRSRIFEPFYTTKGVGKGTGLGLAVVHGIVEEAGGQIAVRSEVGVGTTFEVYLPWVDQPVATRPSRSGDRTAPRGAETVLLVEDEEGVRALTRHVLAAAGYAVLEAADGDEALDIAAGHAGPIHLLMTDVVMPGLGGRELADRVLALHPAAKVLYVSGYTDDAVVRHGVLEEDVQFLQKPFSPGMLAIKVREVLDTPCSSIPTSI